SAAAAGIVTSTTPAVAGTLAVLLLRERLTRARAGGIALAVVGILAVNVSAPAATPPAGPNAPLGNLLVFRAVVGEALFIICGRLAAARLAPLVAATTISVLGFLMFLPFAGGGRMRDAVIVGAVRTAVGRRNGRLSPVRPDDLAAHVLRELVARVGIDASEVEDVILGCVDQVGEQGFNIARNAALIAGFPVDVCGTTLDRMCGS